MKAFKRMATTLTLGSLLSVVGLMIYNSAALNNESYMTMSIGNTFNKRLDEIDGKVVIGRNAASVRSWKRLNSKSKRKQAKAQKAIAQGKFKKATRKLEKVVKADVLEPTIKADLDLQLASVFHKEPLKKGSFSGSARTVDGVIEEVSVNLPNGGVIEINTYDRMVGNVFQYEDPETNEKKSGMLYESGKNKFTVVLTNDSRYQGMKLEFQTNGEEIQYGNNNNQNWGTNNQNSYDDLAAEDILENTDQGNTEYVENNEVQQSNHAYNFNS